MKRLIKYTIFTVAAALVTLGASAQLKTAYFMEGSIPRYDMNVALTPQDGYVNLPLIPLGSLGVNVNNNFLSVQNFLYPNGGTHVLPFHSSVDADTFLRRMPNKPFVGLDVDYNLIGFGNYSRRHGYFWSFTWDIRVMADVNLSKDLFRALKTLGNGIYDFGDVSAHAMAYSEMAFGFTMPTGWQDLVVGGRLKLLFGLAHADARFNSFNISVQPDHVHAEARGDIRGNILGVNLGEVGETGQNLPFNDVFNFKNFGKSNIMRNYGMAVDFGAEMKLFDRRLKLSIGVNDLGFIRWGKGSSIHGSLTDIMFDYRGRNINTGDKGISHTKLEDINIIKTGNEAYNTMLATTLNVGAEYNFFDNLLGVGLLSHTRFWNKRAYSELTLTGTVRPAKWFTAAVSHTFVRNKMGIFGFAFNFHPRGVNFFLGLDYIPTRWAQINVEGVNFHYPVRAKPFNFHIGLAFTPKGPSRGW